MLPPRYEAAVTGDNLLRRDTSMEALAALPPVFDKRFGTVTAGNSSPLTDGAAAVLLMSEERARALGCAPLAFIREWAVAAVDPGGQLLMGPALAIPKALDRAGLTLADMDLIEMHEAHKDAGLVLLGVNLREANSPVQGFVEDFGMPYPILMDRDGEVAATWRIGGPNNGVPSTYFIDSEGVVRLVVFGFLTQDRMTEGLALILPGGA